MDPRILLSVVVSICTLGGIMLLARPPSAPIPQEAVLTTQNVSGQTTAPILLPKQTPAPAANGSTRLYGVPVYNRGHKGIAFDRNRGGYDGVAYRTRNGYVVSRQTRSVTGSLKRSRVKSKISRRFK